MAEALWGRQALAALKEERVEVDWRASPANLVAIATAYGERRGTDGFSPETDLWFRSVIAGLGTAIARQQPLWRHVDLDAPSAESATAPPRGAAASPLRRPV